MILILGFCGFFWTRSLIRRFMIHKSGLSTILVRSRKNVFYTIAGRSWLTCEASWTVHTKQASAHVTGIYFILMHQKRVKAQILNLLQVSDHAHSVFSAISGIQLFQSLTWHLFTFITEMGSIILDSWTVENTAWLTRLSFIWIIPPASGTFLFWALKSQA